MASATPRNYILYFFQEQLKTDAMSQIQIKYIILLLLILEGKYKSHNNIHDKYNNHKK